MPINHQGFVVGTSGNNTIISCPADRRLLLSKVIIYPDADITGEVIILLGGRILSRPRNPKSGGMYGINLPGDYIEGGLGESLVVTLPTTVTVGVDVAWQIG